MSRNEVYKVLVACVDGTYLIELGFILYTIHMACHYAPGDDGRVTSISGSRHPRCALAHVPFISVRYSRLLPPSLLSKPRVRVSENIDAPRSPPDTPLLFVTAASLLRQLRSGASECCSPSTNMEWVRTSKLNQPMGS